MKTALLLTGQPRFVKENYFNIDKNLIKPNNSDVFIHMWNDKYDDKPFRYGEGWKNERLPQNALKLIIDLYNPTCIKAEPQKEFQKLKIDFSNSLKNNYAAGSENPEIAEYYILATQSMWYSIKEAFKLVPLEKYDSIILTRFDIGIPSLIKTNDYDMNMMWHQSINRSELILNWMNFSSPKNMYNVFGKMYDDFLNIYNETNIWCNEFWCKTQCDKFNIKTNGATNWGLSIPSRKL